MNFNSRAPAIAIVLSTFLCSLGADAKGRVKAQPSFDCRRASSEVEKAICASENLIHRDIELASAFTRARKTLAENPERFSELKSTQLEWNKNRQFCLTFLKGEATACLEEAYKRRTADLEKISDKAAWPNTLANDVQPITCELFSSWRVHWEKAPDEDAKKLYGFLSPNLEACWLKLNGKTPATSGEARQYYARNYMQLVREAGADCSEASKLFDTYALSQEQFWSQSTDYFSFRLQCKADDPVLTATLQTKATSLRAQAEGSYAALEKELAKTAQWSEIESEHQELVGIFSKNDIIGKLTIADRRKHDWAKLVSIIRTQPSECLPARGACRKLAVGPKAHRSTLQIHFSPMSEFDAVVDSVELIEPSGKLSKVEFYEEPHVPVQVVDASGKIIDRPDTPERKRASRLSDAWAIEAVDCESNGVLDLALGHSTMKNAYWDAYTFDAETKTLKANSDDCASKNEN